MTDLPRKLNIDSRAVAQFATFGVLIGIANIVPYLISRNAYRTDGLAVAGFPFRYYEKGGIDGHSWFGLWALAANIVFAVAVSALWAWVLRDGMLETVRKMRAWRAANAE